MTVTGSHALVVVPALYTVSMVRSVMETPPDESNTLTVTVAGFCCGCVCPVGQAANKQTSAPIQHNVAAHLKKE